MVCVFVVRFYLFDSERFMPVFDQPVNGYPIEERRPVRLMMLRSPMVVGNISV